jgi:hypothetical protein
MFLIVISHHPPFVKNEYIIYIYIDFKITNEWSKSLFIENYKLKYVFKLLHNMILFMEKNLVSLTMIIDVIVLVNLRIMPKQESRKKDEYYICKIKFLRFNDYYLLKIIIIIEHEIIDSMNGLLSIFSKSLNVESCYNVIIHTATTLQY